MGQMIMRKLGLEDFRVQVIVLLPIWLVQVEIRCVIIPIWSHPDSISQVVAMIYHIRWYPPHWSHLHAPYLSFSSITLPSSQHMKLCLPFLSLHPMIMSWHRVQHTPSAASTQDGLSSLHSHDYDLTPQFGSAFGMPPDTIDHQPTGSSCELNG